MDLVAVTDYHGLPVSLVNRNRMQLIFEKNEQGGETI
jgi:hypothetical protein